MAAILTSPPVRQRLLDDLTSRGLSPEQAEAMLPLLQSSLPDAMQSAATAFTSYMETFLNGAPEMIRNAHIGAFAKDPAQSERANLYRGFTWHILITEVPLVLGDTVCVFEVNGDRRFKPLDEAGETTRIFLPVSAERVLIGTPYRSRPKLDPHLLNKAVARCSYEFFISSVELRSESSLPSSIGKWTGILTEDELRAISVEVRGLRPRQPSSFETSGCAMLIA